MIDTNTTEERVDVPTFTMKRGRTTYEVGLLFSSKEKDDLNEKLKKLLRNEVKNETFNEE